ncbi:putative calcium-dependent protein kinase, partial [Toxoplasma gondii VAND]
RYMRQSHLKNALVNLMAHQLNVTGQQIRHINQIFRQLDKNGDGLLSHQELTEGATVKMIRFLFVFSPSS